jgi:hypothetical protein
VLKNESLRRFLEAGDKITEQAEIVLSNLVLVLANYYNKIEDVILLEVKSLINTLSTILAKNLFVPAYIVAGLCFMLINSIKDLKKSKKDP